MGKNVYPSGSKTYFSSQHIYSASLFAHLAARVEEEYATRDVEPGVHANYQAYASGSVLTAVAFLEAYINELFEQCASGPLTLGGLEAEDAALLARMWKRDIPRTARYRILEKYEIAIDLLGRAPLDRGTEPYQSAAALVALRNELVHFEPELYPVPSPTRPTVDLGDAPKLEAWLRGMQFPLNPFAREDHGFFPDKCLSAGCASWAVETSLAFGKAFLEQAGLVERWKSPFAGPEIESPPSLGGQVESEEE